MPALQEGSDRGRNPLAVGPALALESVSADARNGDGAREESRRCALGGWGWWEKASVEEGQETERGIQQLRPMNARLHHRQPAQFAAMTGSATDFPSASETQQQQNYSRSRESVLSGVGFPPLGAQDGRAGDSLIGDRAALAAAHVQGCCALLARAPRGWVCLSCAEIHVVPRPGWYSPEKYARGERMRRAVAVSDGKCAECGKPVCKENRRLCDRHRLMAAARKRKARKVNNRAAREVLYGDLGQGFENGGGIFTAK